MYLRTEHDKNSLVGVKADFLQSHSHQLLHRLLVPSFRYRLTRHLRLLHATQTHYSYQGRAVSPVRWQTLNGGKCYLSLAVEVGLAECFDGLNIQSFRGQVIRHMVCQVDDSDQRSLERPNPEVLHQPAVTRLIHVHPHKQNLNSRGEVRHQRINICCCLKKCVCVCVLCSYLQPEGLCSAVKGRVDVFKAVRALVDKQQGVVYHRWC